MFRFIPVQALHCSLFQCNEMINLSQEVNNIFTKMVEKINFQAKFEEVKLKLIKLLKYKIKM